MSDRRHVVEIETSVKILGDDGEQVGYTIVPAKIAVDIFSKSLKDILSMTLSEVTEDALYNSAVFFEKRAEQLRKK